MKKSELTRKRILETGVKLWPNVSARQIAQKLGMTHAAISYYYKSDLKDAIAKHAVEIGNSKVIVQLIATKHKAVKEMPQIDRIKHLSTVS